jgi:hypothetical protein
MLRRISEEGRYTSAGHVNGMEIFRGKIVSPDFFVGDKHFKHFEIMWK